MDFKTAAHTAYVIGGTVVMVRTAGTFSYVVVPYKFMAK